MQYANLIWRNGQPYSEMFDDIYYSSDEGESICGEGEFDHVFFKNNGLPERWSEARDFVIAELGFGSGLNCILTIREWLRQTDNDVHKKCLHYIALEKYPLSPEAITSLASRYPELIKYYDELIDVYPPAIEGSHRRHLFDNRVIIHYKFMDAYEALKHESYNVDAWYLDGFSPAKNADMWSLQLFEKIAQNSHYETTCSTYTAAGFVRRNLQSAGFDVDKVSGYGKKREMLVATLNIDQQTSYKFVDKPWFSPPVKPVFSNTRATVIGAGIAGLSVAYSLVKRGWLVTIIDNHGAVAKGTSSNPAAIIYPRLSVNDGVDTEFYLQAYFYTLYVLGLLKKKHRESFWFDNGLLQIIDKRRVTEILRKFKFNKDYIALTETFSNELLKTYLVKNPESVCIEFKDAGVVLPKVLCDVLLQECGDKVEVIHAEVNKISFDDGQWQCGTGDIQISQSDVLVIANGVQLNKLDLGMDYPVESVRGQIAVLDAQRESKNFVKAINAEVYFTPSIDAKHYLGATYSRKDSSVEVNDTDNKKLIADLSAIYPGVFASESITDSWVGFRSMSKDRVPIAGAVPDVQFFNQQYADISHGKKDKEYLPPRCLKGLYVSAAHGSRGFTSSFLCAELIASQIAGEPLPVSKQVSDYLNPSRFVVNDLKRR